MTELSFPTLAEQALENFNAERKVRTVSLVTIAKSFGSTGAKEDGKTVYHFDDDSRIEVTGKGKSHKAMAVLP